MLECVASNEDARLQALLDYDVLDTPPEEAFDRITRLAKIVIGVPMVTVSLIDRRRQWFKSRQGIDATETPRDISFCTHAIAFDEPLIVPDVLEDPRFADNPLVLGPPHIRFYIGVPLKNPDGYNIGTLCCLDTVPRHLSCDQVAILRDLARLVVDELELRRLASTDSLTGAMARGAFLDAAARDFARANRHGRPLSCIMVDADRFKQINDQYGHATGDLALQMIVAQYRAQLRTSDYIGRLGGEEFAIILSETDSVGALDVADRMRKLIAAVVLSTAKGPLSLTVSSGVADLGGGATNLPELLEQADAALYQAKATGRNRCVGYEPASEAAA